MTSPYLEQASRTIAELRAADRKRTRQRLEDLADRLHSAGIRGMNSTDARECGAGMDRQSEAMAIRTMLERHDHLLEALKAIKDDIESGDNTTAHRIASVAIAKATGESNG